MHLCVENVECESNFFHISGKLICFICYLKGERIIAVVPKGMPKAAFLTMPTLMKVG